MLSPKQFKTVALLAQGSTGVEAAKSCNVTPQTISEWRQNPEFKAQLNSMKMEILESVRDKLQSASGTAVQTLVELAESHSHPETRRKAALNILEMTGYTYDTVAMYAWGIDTAVVEEAEHETVTKTVSELATLLRNKIAEGGYRQ